ETAAGMTQRALCVLLLCVLYLITTDHCPLNSEETGPAGPKRTRVRRLGAGIQGPCLWSANAIAIMSPAGPEPTEAAIADHPLASGGSLDQPPNATSCHSRSEERRVGKEGRSRCS